MCHVLRSSFRLRSASGHQGEGGVVFSLKGSLPRADLTLRPQCYDRRLGESHSQPRSEASTTQGSHSASLPKIECPPVEAEDCAIRGKRSSVSVLREFRLVRTVIALHTWYSCFLLQCDKPPPTCTALEQ